MGKRLVGIALFLLVISLAVSAKETPLVAIQLYQGEAGPAYVQVSNFMVNGTRGLSVCAGQPLDNNAYKKLAKIALVPGAVLERDAKGVLTLTTPSGPLCVVPSNLKLEKNKTYTLKELGDLAAIAGTPVSKSSNAGEKLPAAMDAGMQIHMVAAPDTELAEFLRANRAQSISLWSDYLKQYAVAAHAAEARKSLVALLVAEGANHLASYKESLASASPKFGELKAARVDAEQSLAVLPGNAAGDKLRLDAGAEFQAILANARAELSAYLTALNDRTAGYEHLGKAQEHLNHAVEVDPGYAGADKLKADIFANQQALDNAISTAESLLAEKKFDQAHAAIARYSAFAGDLPRIGAVIEAAFQYRRDRARQFATDGKWEEAIADFKRALAYRADPDTEEALKRAQLELASQRDIEAAQKAVEDSRVLALAKQFVEAYQRLESLPDTQRKLVTADMEKLKDDYVQDLLKREATLSRIHVPIRGRADEDGARQAHDFLERASRLSDDQEIKVKLDLLSDRVNEYYLKQARRVLQKPRSTGVGLGWLLLKEAERYRPDNEDTRNELTKFAPEFETRAKLSIAVRFRDQTSRRDSLGFADQLADTLVTGLENSGLPGLKIFQQRAAAEESDLASGPFVANFFIIGSIGQHKVDKKVEQTPLTSHYRAGTHDVKNPAWQEVKRQMDALQPDYERAKQEHTVALARAGNNTRKKEVVDAKARVDELEKKIDDLKKKLDEIPETVLQDIIQPYNYLKKTVQLNAVVDVAFRLTDPGAGTPAASDSVHVEVPKTAVMLENVKAEDVDGIVEEGTPPDELQLLSEAEEQAKSALVKKLVQQLSEVPAKVLEQARALAAKDDSEGAAEKYVLYLNSTLAKETPERSEAQEFLRKEFNISSSIVR